MSEPEGTWRVIKQQSKGYNRPATVIDLVRPPSRSFLNIIRCQVGYEGKCCRFVTGTHFPQTRPGKFSLFAARPFFGCVQAVQPGRGNKLSRNFLLYFCLISPQFLRIPARWSVNFSVNMYTFITLQHPRPARSHIIPSIILGFRGQGMSSCFCVVSPPYHVQLMSCTNPSPPPSLPIWTVKTPDTEFLLCW